jgi:dephospho-CoA kinase
MLRVGLTGGIACGKSRVRRRFAAAGFATLDLDAVAHEVIAPGGAAYADVVSAFGRGILASDGTVDRKVLGSRVFADAEARAQLNALVHPRVRDEEARRAAEEEARGTRAMVTDAALLVEAGLHLRFHRLVVVDCEGGEQLRRLVARDGLDEAAARARIAAQMPAAEKRRFAHVIVDASGGRPETDAHADAAAAELAWLADHPPPRPPFRPDALLAALAAGPERGPRGLDPDACVRAVAATGGVEMERLKALLVPPFPGPWHAAADALPASEPGPEALAPVVGLWSLARRGLDDPFTAAAMFSVARLTHRDPARAAGACLIALAAAHLGAGPAPEAGRDPDTWAATAGRWGGAAVPGWSRAVVAAALAHPDDEGAAAERARRAGADPALARGLAAAATARAPQDAPAELLEAARALASAS